MVEVTQADRDAAKALLDRLHLREHETGSFRSWDETVEAFARHRATNEAARQDVREALVEPALWIYERRGPWPARYMHDERTPGYLQGEGAGDWTETPLYAHPPALSTSPLANKDGPGELDLAAAFGPILKEGFPKDSAHKRAAVAEALAKAVMVRKSWLAPTARQKPPTTTHHTGLIEQAVQAALDASLAENGIHGVAAARHAARFVVEAREYWREYERAELADEIRQISEARRPLANETGALREALPYYDAGLLGDGGGGDVDWWQDYLRAELARAHEFYADHFAALASPDDGEGK